MGETFFDDLENDGSVPARNNKPIWELGLDTAPEKSILDWLNAEVAYLEEESKDRIQKIHNNLALYKGIQYRQQETRSDARDRNDDKARQVPKIVVNNLKDHTKSLVSRIIKYKPAVSVLPTHNEVEDVVSAKASEQLLSHIWYNERFEGDLSLEFVTKVKVCGESYFFILWDKNKGDVSPVYKEALKKAKKAKSDKIALVGEDGEPVKDEAGNTVYIEKEIRVGDVTYQVTMPTDILCQKKQRWNDVEYLFRKVRTTPAELRLMYPKAEIKDDRPSRIYDYESMELRDSQRDIVYFEFWHRYTRGLPKGRKICFLPNQILHNEELPFTHGLLPCVRMTDVDLPGELHGVSFFDDVKGLANTYNNLTNMILRNIYMVSHPKWMGAAGSFKKEALGNEITIVEYKGPIAPQLVQGTSVPSDVFTYSEKVLERMGQLSGIHGVSRGEPPPGIKSGVALQFLSEQEQERMNESILKWNETTKQIAQMTLSVCGDNYDDSDARMLRVLGKDNNWQSVFFDAANLSKDYDIRVQNSSALPQSKAARIQLATDIKTQFPTIISDEQYLDIIDLGQSEKFMSVVTHAVRLAEAENELLLQGDVSVSKKKFKDSDTDPKDHENHVLHWRIHVQKMQEFSYKFMTDKKKKKALEEHLMAHEMFLVEQARKNPAMQEQLATLQGFPLFYVPEEQSLPSPIEPAPVTEMAGGGSEGMPQVPQGAPINPALGGEAQLLTRENIPALTSNQGEALQGEPEGVM